MAEPSLSFDHAALKIEWAEQHIAQLNEASKRWIDTKPYDVTVKTDAKTRHHEFKAGLREPIPSWVPLLIGDICGNLRASLDYAWMGLVRAADPSRSGKETLPFADNRKGLVSKVARAPIGGAAQEAERLLTTVIGTHADFLDGGSKGLVALNKLSNWNKHNLLITGVAVTSMTNVNVGGIRIGRLRVRGGKAHLATFTNLLEQPDFSYDDNATVEVIFGQHAGVQGESVLPTLIQFSELCTKALTTFREAFD